MPLFFIRDYIKIFNDDPLFYISNYINAIFIMP